MKPIKFYKLRTLIEMYGIRFTGSGAGGCGHVTADGKPGVLFGHGGYGVNINDVEKFMDAPCWMKDRDIGYSNIWIEQSTMEAFRRNGYEVELV